MNQLRQFEFILEIAKFGSVSKAAKSLKLSQPTLSKYLAKLEEELGFTLFDRTKIPLKPTEAGKRYLIAGEHIVSTHRKLCKDLEALRKKEGVSLRIGISPTRAHFVLSDLLDAFYNKNTETKLVISEKTVSQLNSALFCGELDMIISLKGESSKQFEEIPLFSERLVLAVPQKYAGLSSEEILKNCPLISTGAGLNVSNALLDIIYEYKREEPFVEVQSIESAISLVALGYGVSLVPSYIIKHAQKEKMFFMELPESLKCYQRLNLGRQVCIFYPKGKELTRAEKDFIESCKHIV